MWRTVMAGAAALLLGGVAQAEAQTIDDRPWTEARACLDETDVPGCWLRLIARRMGPNILRGDPELRQNPGLLDQITPSEPIAPPTTTDDVELPEPMLAFQAALAAAFEKERAGAAAEAVLAPLQTLPVTGAFTIANPLQSSIMSFGRLDAYSTMVMLLNERDAPAQSAASVRAVLAAWERDLQGVDEAILLNEGSASLARRYVGAGDEAAALRVLSRLTPENEPALIEALVEMDRLEEAAAISNAADARRSVDRLRRSRAVLERLAAAQIVEMQAIVDVQMKAEGLEDFMEIARAQAATVDAMVTGDATAAEIEAFNAAHAGYSEEERAAVLADAREWAETAAAAPSPAEEIEMAAEDDLQGARARLMAAADRAGRPELALTAAQKAFTRALADPNRDMFGGDLGQALKLIVRAGTPEQAVAALEAAEAHAGPRRDGGLQSILPAIYDGWILVGRPERATALIAAWRPVAAAQGQAFGKPGAPDGVLGDDGQPGAQQGLQNILVAADDFNGARALGWMSPETELRRDFAAGRGTSRLDERLLARLPEERSPLLIACRYLALEARSIAASVACAERMADIAETPMSKLQAAEGLLEAAWLSAREDDPRSLDLARRAMQLGREAEQTATEPIYNPFRFDQFQDVAKARLRAEGRLPAQATRVLEPAP